MTALPRPAFVLCLLLMLGGATAARADDNADIQALLAGGQAAEALRQIDRLWPDHADEPRLAYQRGIALAALKRPTEAIEAFVRLTEAHPDLPGPFNNLAVVYASQGEFDKARVALEQAVRLAPHYATAWQNLGDIHTRLADEAFRRARESGAAAAGASPSAPAAAATPAAAREDTVVADALQAWARAWSARDLPAYFAAYAPDYHGQAASRADWERERRARIAGKAAISVSLSKLQVEMLGNTAGVHFTQAYAAGPRKESSDKVVELTRSADGRWLITREASARAPAP